MLFGGRGKVMEEWRSTVDVLRKEWAAGQESLKQCLSVCVETAGQDMKGDLDQLARQMNALDGRMSDMEKSQKRQSQCVEDFLDEVQEQTEEEKALCARVKEAQEREECLLSIVCCYQEQLHLMRRQIMEEHREDGDRAAAWEEQFRFMEEDADGRMRAGAMEQTGRTGEPVDFVLHEVLRAIDTEDENLGNRVAGVFRPGCIYHGKVVRKAQVSAYRRISDVSYNRD